MLTRKWVLFALSRVVATGDRDAASGGLQGCDPLLGWRARQQVAAVLHRADLESDVAEAAHAARLASFLTAKVAPEADFDDHAALAAEYEARFGVLAKPASGPRFSIGLLSSVVVITLTIFFAYRMLRPFEPSQSEHGRLFEQDFTELAAAIANRQLDEAAAVWQVFEESESLAPVRKELRALYNASGAVVRAEDPTLTPGGGLSPLQAYRATAVSLNLALEKHELPYYVDADTVFISRPNTPVWSSFYVQARGVYLADQRTVRVVQLWRLDHLNVTSSLLGFTRASSPYAVIHLDRVEQDLVTQLLPSAAQGALMSLTDEDTELSAREWVANLQKEGGRIIRKHYAADPALKERSLRLGRLLAKRRVLLAEWKGRLERDDIKLRLPRRLIPEADYTEQLHLLIPRAQLRDWDAVHAELTSTKSIEDFEALREPYLRTVERHEVQHRLEYAAERLEIPELLAMRMGGIERGGHLVHSLPASASTELAAYLAEMADEPAPLLALLTMTRAFFVKEMIGGPHSYAALVALESIAQKLGIDTQRKLGNRVVRQELADLLVEVCRHPPKKISEAARAAYQALFDEELPRVERGEFSYGEPWRY